MFGRFGLGTMLGKTTNIKHKLPPSVLFEVYTYSDYIHIGYVMGGLLSMSEDVLSATSEQINLHFQIGM